MKNLKIIIIAAFVLTFILLGYRIYKNLFYLSFVNSVEYSEKGQIYALFKHDYLFANPNFYVFRFDREINPKDLNYKSTYNIFLTQEEYNKTMDKVILENYEEDDSKTSNPNIKILEKHFLVMERGGYYFSLYNLKTNKSIFNNCCPFSDWARQNIWSEKGTYYNGIIEKNEKSDYGIWIKKNIHNKILKYIENNK
jgi:hypothetical protein